MKHKPTRGPSTLGFLCLTSLRSTPCVRGARRPREGWGTRASADVGSFAPPPPLSLAASAAAVSEQPPGAAAMAAAARREARLACVKTAARGVEAWGRANVEVTRALAALASAVLSQS